jgi:hypothetical protein
VNEEFLDKETEKTTLIMKEIEGNLKSRRLLADLEPVK